MSDTEGTQERPRRSARTPNKSPATVVNGPSSKPAARRKARDPGAQLDHLLTNSKSQLTKVDISDVLNFDNFLELSVESQELLCSLFPATAFSTFQPTIDPTHPANMGKGGPESSSQESPPKPLSATFDRSPTTLDPVVFTSPFFLSAARTFQDHIYSGWLASKAKDLVKQYEQGVGEGSLHAEWKDEEWERNRNPLKRQAT
ncbi:hypothetical protein PHLCEN_2v8066 [Hermanssonia centrifuga]|uniref:ASX DEUBAD domain-containing protein n=1 Tax=Hermanssonia centrifuga TaxID=98765 RepID=A0A2R6NVA9_9APHY|nr:hypothetical protein PHLCEN_2v8066 [Hermanssonia centrifuga]